MKQNPSPKTGGPQAVDLQARLFVLFTGLFLFSALMLSLFLYNNVRMVTINNRARSVFEQNRRLFNLRAMTLDYEIAVNNYELNASTQAKILLEMQSRRIDELVTAIRPALEASDQRSLDQFAADKEKVSEIYAQITEAVDGEDWASVLMLDNQASKLIEQMYAQIDAVSERGTAELDQVRAEVKRFKRVSSFGTLLALPIFLLLAGIAAMVIYLQIHQPVELLARQSTEVLTGALNMPALEKLAARGDEVGYMAGEFLAMDRAIDQRTAELTGEVDEIRQKIR